MFSIHVNPFSSQPENDIEMIREIPLRITGIALLFRQHPEEI